MSNPIQQSPFIRSQRAFPFDDVKRLSAETDRMYVDMADKLNAKTIGTFAMGSPITTGEQWYLKGSSQKQQTQRQVYMLNGTNPIIHGINISNISGFTRIYGTFTDGVNWYPLPYVDISNVTNQVNVTINSTQIVLNFGAGAPSVSNGYIVLEWLATV